MKVFVYTNKSSKKEAVNVDKYSSVKLEKNIIGFYNTITDRVNWEFETEEEAQKVYNELMLQHGNEIAV